MALSKEELLYTNASKLLCTASKNSCRFYSVNCLGLTSYFISYLVTGISNERVGDESSLRLSR